MKLNAYTIFDTASGTYWKPIYAKSDGEIIREFKGLSVNAEHPIGQHPEDYSLWRVGLFDDNTAELIPETKECLITALEAVAASRQIDRQKMDAMEMGVEVAKLSPGGTA